MSTKQERHEFVFGYPNSETCSFVVDAETRCGQPADAPIHRAPAETWTCGHCGNTRTTNRKPDPLLCITCFGDGHRGDKDSCSKCNAAPSTEATPPDDDAPRYLKLWICSKCLAPRLYGTEGGCYACGTLIHVTAEYILKSTHDREVERLSVASAMAELRKLWPGCSFEIQDSRNAGFHQDATQHFEIGVISTQHEVHERFKGRTLAEAMQKVREFHAACATAREAMKEQ